MCVDDEELLPPHPTENAQTSRTIGAASTGKRLRFRTHSNVEPRNISVQRSIVGPDGKLTRGTAPDVTDAVVATFTVTVCVPVPVICTEEGTLHVGAGVAAGVIAQLRLTVPVKDPLPAKAKLKLAVCPALMLWEVGEPEAAPTVKSETACTTSDAAMLFTVDPAVPWI